MSAKLPLSRKKRSGPGTQSPGAPEAPGHAGIGLFGRLRAYFLAGILVTAPIAFTLYITWIVIRFLDNRTQPLIRQFRDFLPPEYADFYIPGLGILMAVILLTLIGAMTANYVGRLVVRVSESVLVRMPVVRSLYAATKQIFETVLARQSTAFREVVLVEYPRRGAWSLAFKTGVTEGPIQSMSADRMINVFVPTTPNPTSGFLLFVPEQECVRLEMGIEEAVKYIISGGIVAPPDRRPDSERAAPMIPPAGQRLENAPDSAASPNTSSPNTSSPRASDGK